MELFCANEQCKWHTERKGGRFRYRNGNPYCDECVSEYQIGEPGKNLWSFQTLNIGSDPSKGPIQVKSLRHLRQLEREHGVVSVAANFDSKHWDQPTRGR